MSTLGNEKNCACCGSESPAHQIVRWVSDKTIEVREVLSANRHSGKHCVSKHAQTWVVSFARQNPAFRIRLNKKGWQDKSGTIYHLSDVACSKGGS